MLFSLLLMLGCAERARVLTVGTMAEGALKVSTPVILMDLPAAPSAVFEMGQIEATVLDDGQAPPTVLDPVRDGAFLRNDFVGNIRFGGGLIKTGAVALETRARFIELQPDPLLRQQGVAWLRGLADSWGPAVAAPPTDLRFDYDLVRGEDKDDDTDNLNLPRTTLRPLPITVQERVLVPILRAYYTHNGGWFLGQRWGCLAGARIDVVMVLYEGGVPVWWREVSARSIDGGEAQGTRAELDARLLDAEQQVAEALRRGR